MPWFCTWRQGRSVFFGEELELGRTASFLFFFLIGYKLNWKTLERIRGLAFWKTAVLAAAFTAIVVLYCFVLPYSSEFLLFRSPGSFYGLGWYQDISGRILIGAATLSMMTVLLNRMPDRPSFLTRIGRNTMPLYIFHLFIRYLVKVWGIPSANPVLYYGMILVLWIGTILIFTSKPSIRLYDWIMDRIEKRTFKMMEFFR